MSYQEDFQWLLDKNPNMGVVMCANEAWEHLGFADKEIAEFKLLAEQLVAAKNPKDMMKVRNKAACILNTYKEQIDLDEDKLSLHGAGGVTRRMTDKERINELKAKLEELAQLVIYIKGPKDVLKARNKAMRLLNGDI